MKRILCSALISAVLIPACESDTTRPVICDDCVIIPPPITKENVLSILEASYNQRKIAPYAELLDAEFTFFFSPADVSSGATPEQWGRADELEAATRLFDKDLNDPNYPTCRSIRLDIKFEDGVQWIEIVPESHPDETWYSLTVYYVFKFEMLPDQTYISIPGAQVRFTVRNVGTDAEPKWRLVEWRDLGQFSPPPSVMSSLSTESTTWGGVKALYR